MLQPPSVVYFRPQGIPLFQLEQVVLDVDEYDALRLVDLEGLQQQEEAERMKVSHATCPHSGRHSPQIGGRSPHHREGDPHRRGQLRAGQQSLPLQRVQWILGNTLVAGTTKSWTWAGRWARSRQIAQSAMAIQGKLAVNDAVSADLPYAAFLPWPSTTSSPLRKCWKTSSRGG